MGGVLHGRYEQARKNCIVVTFESMMREMVDFWMDKK
jgi:hypothetical protein